MILTVQQDGGGDDISMKRHEMEICSWSDKLSDGIQVFPQSTEVIL